MTIDRETIEKLISKAIRALILLLIALIGISLLNIERKKLPDAEIQKKLAEQREMFAEIGKKQVENSNLPSTWPPEMNVAYPSFDLIDQYGTPFTTEELRGRIVLIEYIDMSSPISQAQSGGNDIGPYGAGKTSDPLTDPIATVLKQSTFGDITLPDPQILVLKVIVYGLDGSQATREDAYNWAQHFGLKKENNVVVAIPEKDMRDNRTERMITGYQLLDQNLRLRVDSAGLEPKHSLSLTLAPMVPKLKQ